MIFEILLLLYFIGSLLGLWLLFKKVGEKPWKSLIPFYNLMVWIKICGKDRTKSQKIKWYIGFLIPAWNIFLFLLLVPPYRRAPSSVIGKRLVGRHYLRTGGCHDHTFHVV